MGWSPKSLIIYTLFIIVVHSRVYAQKCNPDDSSALLKLKSSLPVDLTFCGRVAKTSNWNERTSCCTWNGVTCGNSTGHVIGLDLSCGGVSGVITSKSSLFSLTHLQSLDLSMNKFRGSIVPAFGRFRNLTRLEISSTYFEGDLPQEISQLTELAYLDISAARSIQIGAATFRALAQNLTRLRELILTNVDLSSVPSVYFSNFTSLEYLWLSNSNLRGEFPENTIFQLPKLQVFSCYYNWEFMDHFPSSDNWTSPIQELEIVYSYYLDSESLLDLPRVLRNGRSLSDLSLNGFQLANNSSHIPWSLINFKRFRSLDLSSISLKGQIPDIQIASNLTTLRLSRNLLDGTIPSWIFELPYLSDLDLSKNNFSGYIREFRSKSLTRLDLSSNLFTGNLDLKELSNLKQLFILDLSFNNLSVHFNNSINYTFPNLLYLHLSSCNISEDFPNFLRSSKDLNYLDLSSNQITGSIPKWLWDMGKDSINYLNLSRNSLTFMDSLPWNSLEIVDLSSNLFSGEIPISSAPSLNVFLGSKNQFRGEITTSFCDMASLELLDLSDNNLTGEIPRCLLNSSTSLSVLDLKRNRLHGNIPTALLMDNMLRNLNLNGNYLDGALPKSLMNCSSLEVLDVGNNLLNGTFPDWIESLTQLRVLVLRSNMFHGPIENPSNILPFQGLRILDISDNKFNGPLPTKLFENFKAMMDTEHVEMEYMGYYYYQDSVMVTMKGNVIELVKIQTIFTTVDFSCNDFTGDIPSLIGRLKSLKGLNFSHNMLSGSIPSTLGNLSNLEWLDLSSNQLTGGIPPELAGIRWLSFLNLSHNQLVGPIPQGSQFNTFGNESFIGNLDLCGYPLSKMCGKDTDETPNSDQEDDDSNDPNWFDWKIVLMGYACGIVIGISSGYILLSSGGKLNWLSESVLLELALLSRKFQDSNLRKRKKEKKRDGSQQR